MILCMEAKINYESFDEEVDRYLRNQMNTDEEKSFLNELHNNSDKKERASIIALMIKTMYENGVKTDKAVVDKIYKLNKTQFRQAMGFKQRTLYLHLRWIKFFVAACIVVFFSLGGYNYYKNQQIIKLGNTQYSTYELDVAEIHHIRGDIDNDCIKQLRGLFANVKNSIDIDSTLKELKALYRKASDKESIYYDFQDDISWNLAIAFLKTGDRNSPIPILKAMISRNEDYPQIAQPAQNLLDKINAL